MIENITTVTKNIAPSLLAGSIALSAVIKEDQVRAVIAVVVIGVAAFSALLPYSTDSIRWLQGLAFFITGFYFGRAGDKLAAQNKKEKES